jgi:hypothetical protein
MATSRVAAARTRQKVAEVKERAEANGRTTDDLAHAANPDGTVESPAALDPTDASGADGANGTTDRKPRAGKRTRMPKPTAPAEDSADQLTAEQEAIARNIAANQGKPDQPATGAGKAPSTQAQRERIAELYVSRDYPPEKRKPPEEYSKLGASRMISLLESRPLKEEAGLSVDRETGAKLAEAVKKPTAPKARKRPPAKRGRATSQPSSNGFDPSDPATREQVVALKTSG